MKYIYSGKEVIQNINNIFIMKVYIAKDWTGSHVFAKPPVLMKCGGMPDIWSGHKLLFDITGSFAEDEIPKGEYLERNVLWSLVHIIE